MEFLKETKVLPNTIKNLKDLTEYLGNDKKARETTSSAYHDAAFDTRATALNYFEMIDKISGLNKRLK